MPLVLYRRHKRGCIKGYVQGKRVFQPRTERERKVDCECPIVASGSLKLEAKRIQRVSTDTNRWEKAKSTKERWEAWQALCDPNPTQPPPEQQNISFDEAAERYMRLKGSFGENLERSSLAKYQVWLYQRIKPFCAVCRVLTSEGGAHRPLRSQSGRLVGKSTASTHIIGSRSIRQIDCSDDLYRDCRYIPIGQAPTIGNRLTLRKNDLEFTQPRGN